MKDELKNKLDLLDIPAPSSNFESRILREGISASKETRTNRNPQSISTSVKSASDSIFSLLTSSFKPIALVACLAMFALLIFTKEGVHPKYNTVIAKTIPVESGNDEDSLEEFTLFDEDEFLFDADWII